MDETAILIIQEYVDKHLFDPELSWPKSIFNERSYARWAAFEIQKSIMDELLQPPEYISGHEPMAPMGIILQFMSDVERCLRLAKDTPNEVLFSTAKETATEILYLFV